MDGSPLQATVPAGDAAQALGFTKVRGFWNWIDDTHLPYDTTACEREMFGTNIGYTRERMELQEKLELTRKRNLERRAKPMPEEETREAVAEEPQPAAMTHGGRPEDLEWEEELADVGVSRASEASSSHAAASAISGNNNGAHPPCFPDAKLFRREVPDLIADKGLVLFEEL